MTFERKLFYREYKGVDEWGELKCPSCNWAARALFRIGKNSKDEMCANCLADRIIKKGYHIHGED
jgi:hypothetical protein